MKAVLGYRECDSPKILNPVVLFDKLDSVGVNSLKDADLRDDTGINLSTKLISHADDGANQELTIYLDGGSMPIQIGCSDRHRKGALFAVLIRQPYGSLERNPPAPALGDLIASNPYSD